MKKRLIPLAAAVLIILTGIVLYQTVYLEIQSEINAEARSNSRKMKNLAYQEKLILSKASIEQQASELREIKKREEARLFEGQTPALAGAALQSRVKEILAGARCSISSQRSEKPEVVGAFQVISISVDADLPDARALADMLYALETHSPRMVIREIDIMTKNFRDPKDLTVKLRISALARGK